MANNKLSTNHLTPSSNIEDNFRAQLKKMGCRCTPERLQMLRAIVSMPSLFEFDTLRTYIENQADFPLSRSTLFNCINQFMQMGMLQKHIFNEKTVYQFCARPTETQCLTVCNECGNIKTLVAKNILSAITHINTHGFVVEHSTLYLRGICADCNKKRLKNAKANKLKKQ